MLRRIAYSLILTSLCLAVLATHVSPGFERIRTRVITSPTDGVTSTLRIPLPDLTRLSSAPAAIVIRTRGAVEPVAVRITIDDVRVTDLLLPAGRETRFDVPAMVPPGTGHHLVLAGDRSGWQVTYLEVANVYGHSSGLFEFVIVPVARAAAPVSTWLLLLFAGAALASRPRVDWLGSRIWRYLYWLGVCVILGLFTATLAADKVSQYRILLSPTTFIICAAVLYADPLLRLARASRPPLRVIFPAVEPYLPHVGAVAVILWSLGQFYHPETGFTSLIVFGDYFEATALPSVRAVPHTLN